MFDSLLFCCTVLFIVTVSLVILIYLDFSPLQFLPVSSSSLVITDPNSGCETLILKQGCGGLPPTLSPCVYFAASPPRSLSMTPGDD